MFRLTIEVESDEPLLSVQGPNKVTSDGYIKSREQAHHALDALLNVMEVPSDNTDPDGTFWPPNEERYGTPGMGSVEGPLV